MTKVIVKPASANPRIIIKSQGTQGPSGAYFRVVDTASELIPSFGSNRDTAITIIDGYEYRKTNGIWAATGRRFWGTLLEDTSEMRDEAIAARDKSEAWAAYPEDMEVEDGKYSSLHYAAKAKIENDQAATHSAASAASAAASAVSEANAATSATQAETSNQQSSAHSAAALVSANNSEASNQQSEAQALLSANSAASSETSNQESAASANDSLTSENNAAAHEAAASSFASQADADRLATAADRVATGQDKADAAASALSSSASAGNAATDAASTSADKVATAADRVATGSDRTAANSSASAAEASRSATSTLRDETQVLRDQSEGFKNSAASSDASAAAHDISAAASAATAGTVLNNLDGGTTGQMLVKRSDVDYDYEFATPASGGDMFKSVFDPTGKNADAFNMANFDEAVNARIMTDDERAAIAANTGARHSHTNKATLDLITAAFLADDRTKLDNIAANATANTGTVTSVALGVPLGFAASAPITTSGTITISYTAGYQGFTTVQSNKLTGIQDGAQVNPNMALYQTVAQKAVANGYAGLDGSGKVPTSQLPDSVLGAMIFQNFWNAATNSPAIPTAAAANKGHYYIVQVAGATNQGGVTDWEVGDWIVSNGSTWGKIDNTDAVSSVAGLKGPVEAAALKSALALNLVSNTADADKPVSTAQATAIGLKANAAITITANNGLDGGGTLAANRTIGLSAASQTSLGKADSAVQPAALDTALSGKLDKTAQAADSAKLGNETAAQWDAKIDAAGNWPGVYSGSNASEVNFPIGHIIVSTVVGGLARNATATVRLFTGANQTYGEAGTGAIVTGVWRARGLSYPPNAVLMQRVE